MAISIETLALARKYADAISAAGSKEALDKAIQQAIAESKLYTVDVFSHIVEIVDSLPTISVNDTEENLIIVKKGETKEPTK